MWEISYLGESLSCLFACMYKKNYLTLFLIGFPFFLFFPLQKSSICDSKVPTQNKEWSGSKETGKFSEQVGQRFHPCTNLVVPHKTKFASETALDPGRQILLLSWNNINAISSILFQAPSVFIGGGGGLESFFNICNYSFLLLCHVHVCSFSP